MNEENVIASISKKGGGEIYLGIVGAVRTGKSTFIKRFIEKLVVPNIEDEYEKKKCLDELPQCAQGKTIMTTEPKFVPSSGATIKVEDFKTNIKLVDCVGYVIPDASGFTDEDGNPRLVKSPWFDDYIPLTEAASIGTEKVIKDHATIAIVVTTDGTITDIKRENYLDAEEKVISELKEIGKPFIVVLNSKEPDSENAINIAKEIEMLYDVSVTRCSVDNLSKDDINTILRKALDEFPIESINYNIPSWINILPNDNDIKMHFINKIKESSISAQKIKDVNQILSFFEDSSYISRSYISSLDSGSGIVTITLDTDDDLYQNILNEVIGNDTLSKANLLNMFISYKENEEELKNIKSAIKMTKNAGYGIIYPTLKDMKLETPEIVKQGSRYGVKLKASASSIHMI